MLYKAWYIYVMDKETEFNLDVILVKKKITMMDAVRMCDLSYPTIFALVKNKSVQVTLKTLDKLRIGLNVKLSDLFREKVK